MREVVRRGVAVKRSQVGLDARILRQSHDCGFKTSNPGRIEHGSLDKNANNGLDFTHLILNPNELGIRHIDLARRHRNCRSAFRAWHAPNGQIFDICEKLVNSAFAAFRVDERGSNGRGVDLAACQGIRDMFYPSALRRIVHCAEIASPP